MTVHTKNYVKGLDILARMKAPMNVDSAGALSHTHSLPSSTYLFAHSIQVYLSTPALYVTVCCFVIIAVPCHTLATNAVPWPQPWPRPKPKQ
jgi:hypothetical protein